MCIKFHLVDLKSVGEVEDTTFHNQTNCQSVYSGIPRHTISLVGVIITGLPHVCRENKNKKQRKKTQFRGKLHVLKVNVRKPAINRYSNLGILRAV